MIDIVERLKDAENATHTLFKYIFQDAREEIERLHAKVEQMERQEPVAWYSKQYGFVYMSRQPGQFEHGSILYLRNGAPALRIEGDSKVALLDIASLPHGTVFYALPGAQTHGEEK